VAGKPDFRITHAGANEVIQIGSGVFTWVNDLGKMFNLLPESMQWRYDDNSSILGIQSEDNLKDGMQEIIDSFLEDLRAQTLAAGWRSQEACEAAIYSLNRGWIASFIGLARMSLESAFFSMARFQDLIVRLRSLNNATTAEKWSKEWGLFDKSNNEANFGRHRENPGEYAFSAASVSKLMDKSMEYLKAENVDQPALDRLKSVYTGLCEVTHPNAEGLQIYWDLSGAEPIFPGAPSYRRIDCYHGQTLNKSDISLLNGLWAIGFSAHFSTEVYYRMENLKVEVLNRKSGFAKRIDVVDEGRGSRHLV
jgi:hypothetical protein